MKIKISSRQSELARWQAYQVGEALQNAQPGLEIEYLFRESLGDINQKDPLWKMPEKGVFTKDFYDDLVNEKTDMIVHSWKDLPTEMTPETMIAATLKRADQRDLLLFKKSSRGKKNVQIFTSSPRRMHNLKKFFDWSLPWTKDDLKFENIRGNIPTRIRKWLADENTDGLILAKAALDRLLDGDRFTETKEFLQNSIQACDWMVLPLTVNPNAAAQGALAVEIKNTRKDIFDLVQKINCAETFIAAEKERQILKSYGGGCHLALGMSCLNRPYGQIEIVQGLTPSGDPVSVKKFTPYKSIPSALEKLRLDFKVVRTALPVPEISSVDALYVTKADAWPAALKFSGTVWSAGLETWKKLSSQGIWVNGSSESLGEHEDERIQPFFKAPLKWGRLSHSDSRTDASRKTFATYQLEFELLSQSIKSQDAFIWTSPQEFDVALKRFPELKNAVHICGPGRTFQAICDRLGSSENVYVDLF